MITVSTWTSRSRALDVSSRNSDSGVVIRMSAASRRNLARSEAGVSPVRIAMRGMVIGAFAAGKLVYVQQIGVGIGAAIALDVTLVRALLVPAIMQLLGAWNWWVPRWLHLPGSSSVAHRAPAPSGCQASGRGCRQETAP